MIIKRVGPVSCAKITGTLYAIFGLLGGIVFSLASLVGAFASAARGGSALALLGVGSIVVFPLVYGAIGFVATLIGAWLYNVLAGVVGGIEIDVA